MNFANSSRGATWSTWRSGVIVGGAFGKIVTSLVGDLIMPPIGLLLGGIDFSSLKLVIKPADVATKSAEVAIRYGVFLNTILQFLIVAAAVFLLVKAINTIRRRQDADPAPLRRRRRRRRRCWWR